MVIYKNNKEIMYSIFFSDFMKEIIFLEKWLKRKSNLCYIFLNGSLLKWVLKLGNSFNVLDYSCVVKVF